MRKLRHDKKRHHNGLAQRRNAPSIGSPDGIHRKADISRDRSCVLLPPLRMSRNAPVSSNSISATQELRHTIMQLTGEHSGIGERILDLSNTNVFSTMDAFMELCMIGADDDTKNAVRVRRSMSPTTLLTCDTNIIMDDISPRCCEQVVVNSPWYQPPMSIALLWQTCCSNVDLPLFSRHAVERVSTMTNFSSIVMSSSSCCCSSYKRNKKEENVKNNKEVKKFLPSLIITASENVKKRQDAHVISLQGFDDKERLSKLRAQRFKTFINQWCDKVMLSSDDGKSTNDPIIAHEQCMMSLHKEEETRRLLMQFKRHQTVQERERRRRARVEEERQDALWRASLEVKFKDKDWKCLLTSGNFESDKHVDEGEKKMSVVGTECKNLKITLPHITQPKTFIPFTQPTFMQSCNTVVKPKDVKFPYTGDQNSADCSPLYELQRLVEIVVRRSTGIVSWGPLNNNTSTRMELCPQVSSRVAAYFPPEGSVYTNINWVERVIQADDLPGLKQLTQQLGKYLALRNISEFSLHSKLEIQDASSSGHSAAERESIKPSCSLLLLPLYLYFSVHGVRERFIIADAISLIPSRYSLGQWRRNEGDLDGLNGMKIRPCQHKSSDANESNEDEVMTFDIYESLLTADDIIGEAPQHYETFFGYSIDVHTIVHQSKWRSFWMKRLANEENIQVQRCLLAKVLVTLSIHAVLSTQDQKRDAAKLQGDQLPTKTVEVDFLKASLSFMPPTFQQCFQVAPIRRVYYSVDMRQMYLVAISALTETNETILAALKNMRTQYRNLIGKLLLSAKPFEDSSQEFPFLFSSTKAECTARQWSDVMELLQLEATYSKMLATLHRNECAIIHYNLHWAPYCEFMNKSKKLWGPLYLRTLRLAYIFCVLVKNLGILPIPPKYRSFLGPVLRLLGCLGGQRELRFRVDEYLLDLEVRAKWVHMPLLFRELTTEHMAELDAAAEAVAEGRCDASQIITPLAVPEDVVGLEPKLVMIPKVLFADIPSIAGSC